MTGRRIRQFVPDLVDKTNAYASDRGYGGPSLFPELEDRLPMVLTSATTDGWTLQTQDLRFHYALGQLYGKRAVSRAFDLRAEVANDAGIELDDDTDDDTTDDDISDQ